MKIFITLTLLFIAQSLTAQDLIPFRDAQGKWGFCDKEKRIVVQPKYDKVKEFENGAACVNIGGTFDNDSTMTGGKWGLIDILGKEIVAPRYDEIGFWGYGYAGVHIAGKQGLINTKGKEIIQPRYDHIKFSDPDGGYFPKGYAKVQVGDKWGLVDTNGIEIVFPRYENVWVLEKGFSAVMMGKTLSFFDRSGKSIKASLIEKLAQLPAPAIVNVPPKIITFDSLTTTVVQFELRPLLYLLSGSKPVIEVTSVAQNGSTKPIKLPFELDASDYSMCGECSHAEGSRSVRLRVKKSLQAGTYRMKITYQSISGKAAVASCIVKVLPTTLDSTTLQALEKQKMYFGKRLTLRSKLPAEAVELPQQQFRIDYRLGDNKPVQDIHYSQNWSGPHIPASAKTVQVSIMWVHPETNERVRLWSKEYQPMQDAPEAIFSSASYDNPNIEQDTSGIKITIKGIVLDCDIPIDAKIQTYQSNSIRGAGANPQVVSVSIHKDKTNLLLFNEANGDPDEPVEQKFLDSVKSLTRQNLEILTSSLIHDSNGCAQINVVLRLKNLQTSSLALGNTQMRNIIEGTLVLRMTISIKNPINGVEGSGEITLTIPISGRTNQ